MQPNSLNLDRSGGQDLGLLAQTWACFDDGQACRAFAPLSNQGAFIEAGRPRCESHAYQIKN